jgi:serine/threonine-protein phosphatase 2A activator
VQATVELVNEINSWVDEIPPIQQPMRFGNKAFRSFFDRVVEVGRELAPGSNPSTSRSFADVSSLVYTAIGGDAAKVAA